MPKARLVGAVLLLAGAVVLIRQAMSMQSPRPGGSQETKSAVLLMLGEKAAGVERWDGKATVKPREQRQGGGSYQGGQQRAAAPAPKTDDDVPY